MKYHNKFWVWFRRNQSYVPSTKTYEPLAICLSLQVFTLLTITTTNFIKCESAHEHNDHRYHQYKYADQPITSFLDPMVYYDEPSIARYRSARGHNSDEPTPSLLNAFSSAPRRRHIDDFSSPTITENQHLVYLENVIRAPRSPTQVALDANLISPVFDARPTEHTQEAPQQDASQFSSQTDANNLDIVEQGSGSGWPDVIPFGGGGEDVATLIDPSMVTRVATPTGSQMTPMFEPMSNQPGGDNHPELMRRLPKLVATSGSSWRYVIPSDTFQDEDGDLRSLKSSLSLKQAPEKLNSIEANPQVTLDRFVHWLQYDQDTRTLYGFPTDADIGYHSYTLQVYDRWNSMNNETIEIIVRPHQSSRAFTHSITIGIELAPRKRASMVEVLTDLVKLISEGVFNDANGNNMILHAYKQSPEAPSQETSNLHSNSQLSISWSNSSLPIHPCDLGSIEIVFKSLVDNRYISPTWSVQTHGGSELAPSKSLIKALSPDFKPSSVSISLQAACGSRKASSENAIQGPNSLDTEPRVRNRIGKIQWKLGQPIIYRVPNNVFTSGDGSKTTANFSLALHTIDGKILVQDTGYDFLEFDQENQTIYGLSYDFTKHVGQKELLLTARNPVTNQMTRETLVIDIEPQDLTTINNRAFRMSLYFIVRTNAFGPREKVQIGRRMISALQLGDLNYDHDQESSEFTVMDIQQFTTSSILESSAALNDPANSWKYQDKIYLVNDVTRPLGYKSNSDGTMFYKFTWTNETIGYRGECPVEVIKENILYALERSMIDYIPPTELKLDEPGKNDSVRFYERLRSYFEPELDLIHLRFEPLGACTDALELHDVGNSFVADAVDRAGEAEPITEPPPTPHIRSTGVIARTKDTSPVNSDEYWAIVVLIILVVAIIFVVMMLFMGLHTYRINQEKRFELQLKLAQARQNSMYLSSMMLADQTYAGELLSQQAGLTKPAYVDERSARKPVILDAEKQFLANGHSSTPMCKQTSVHMTGGTVQTLPLRPNTTFTMDSIANVQISGNMPKVGPNTVIANQQTFADGAHQSMTLNRRVVGGQSRIMSRQGSMNQLNQPQSIMAVSSTGHPEPYIPQPHAALPFVYAPMPVFYESAAETPREL